MTDNKTDAKEYPLSWITAWPEHLGVFGNTKVVPAEDYDKLMRELKALREMLEDVGEILSLNSEITSMLHLDHGWTPEQIAKHRDNVNDRELLEHSLRAQISRLRLPPSAGD